MAAVPAGARYPTRRAERDHYVLARRGSAPRPPDAWRHQGVLVEPERTPGGPLAEVATVFLTGRECPWRCVMCDLWRHTVPGDTPVGAIPRQIATAVEELQGRSTMPVCVKLYNASNFFDARAVPPDDDEAILAALAPFTHVIVESHPALVGERTWRLRDGLARRQATLEVAMGLETARPAALEALNKGITVERFAEVSARLTSEQVALRVFLLVSPPFVPAAEQDVALSQSVAFAAACGASAVSLIPTRPGEGALQALAAAGEFTAPRLADVERSAGVALTALAPATGRQPGTRVFVDLWELERFASCAACGRARRDRLGTFNHTQRVPPALTCEICHEVTPA